ncbi:DUF2382 domain-containing protein [Streptomyces tsukubensis]|uniref:Photosystem reaction center subunit H n=1 Tax=Streptomyces tsukubensis TaxID=83656 RepID=A0A1V4AGH6_9ACTN|nr:PRC and DUF2382 domain-containing protein [Streptomyces tsukubensis]OON82543.1 photosystem reaction center subunit H [Streptomyces tsukubensis]QFR92293.1 DUF2382 domain-containing protein [Streptomyces tsukubensis]
MAVDGVFDNPNELNGLDVYDVDGAKIGGVGQVYLDDRTGKPEWLTVKTGLFGMKETFVPVKGAEHSGDGLHIPYSKETVKDAPRLEADEHLDADQERELYSHYGLTRAGDTQAAGVKDGPADTSARTGPAATTGTVGMAGEREAAGMAGAGMAGAGAPARSADYGRTGRGGSGEEMVRSEEEMHIGKEEQEVGRARLRKVVETEHVSTTVPLSHEEVHVVREPISADDRTSRTAPIGESETEVVLHAEQAVVSKESVPVERVRLETERVTEQQEVASDVRKEKIEYDDGSEPGKRHGNKRGPSH